MKNKIRIDTKIKHVSVGVGNRSTPFNLGLISNRYNNVYIHIRTQSQSKKMKDLIKAKPSNGKIYGNQNLSKYVEIRKKEKEREMKIY